MLHSRQGWLTRRRASQQQSKSATYLLFNSILGLLNNSLCLWIVLARLIKNNRKCIAHLGNWLLCRSSLLLCNASWLGGLGGSGFLWSSLCTSVRSSSLLWCCGGGLRDSWEYSGPRVSCMWILALIFKVTR
jgi:hypothetical protein